ncbi:MAG: 3-deoxy-manno-octulosonate cytidylyltransferase [Bacteroidales bacterium]|nr:3-deoxy-manno-octulosonate cytidylyltransferase [Bacteroidales bacterium]
MTENKFIGIIPARYASSRFPGKPLAMIGNKPMIQRVYEQAKKVIETVFVATDDNRIYDTVKNFGGNVVITSADHPNGTSRCFEAIQHINEDANIVINIQGDEPFINPEQLNELKTLFKNPAVTIGTQIKKITKVEDLFNPNIPKVVVNEQRQAIYFSRSPIPFLRNVPEKEWLVHHTFYKHIGLYAYRKEILSKLVNLSLSPNEKAESLEQLRWIDHGFEIQTHITDFESIGIDIPEDIAKIPKDWL